MILFFLFLLATIFFAGAVFLSIKKHPWYFQNTTRSIFHGLFLLGVFAAGLLVAFYLFSDNLPSAKSGFKNNFEAMLFFSAAIVPGLATYAMHFLFINLLKKRSQ